MWTALWDGGEPKVALLPVLETSREPLQGAPPAPATPDDEKSPHMSLRIMTFNVGDVRTEDLADGNNPRLKRLAEVIQRIRPNVLLLNEIAYDMPGVLSTPADAHAGQNGQKFADLYLGVEQSPGIAPLHYAAFMAPVNTGVASGHDLDNNGKVVTTYPTPPAALADGTHPEPSPEALAYGGDCWGFGTFPGQYGMALLVDKRLEILGGEVRTFRLMPWDFIPGALQPMGPGGKPWYSAEARRDFRLSSKSHWDVPVKLPNKAVIHFLCSHPTPPTFDGPEDRNGLRNHDEIRFWADYVENASYIVDDTNTPGGIDKRFHFVIMGDLNADPVKGDSYKNPIKNGLLTSRSLHRDSPPIADVPIEGLAADDTAMFKLRVDYVLPSRTLGVVRSGVWRSAPIAPVSGLALPFPSDHFPVWMELLVPDEL